MMYQLVIIILEYDSRSVNVVGDVLGGPAVGGGTGNMAMPPQFGYHGMPMGAGGGQIPFMNPGMGGGPPFMPPGPPMNPPSGAAAHHVPPGSGCVVLVSNLDPEVSQSAGFRLHSTSRE